ncbi:MAG: LapA family protein [Deltaproteobacteria bacterium]|nr:LapA family protein [Deltaproteobacteria bacterium]
MKPKHILILTAIILALIFFIQNTQIVTLRLFFWKFSMTQIILLPLTMLIGFALGYIVAKVTGKR